MLDVVEDVKNEFKVKLTDKLFGGLMIKAKLLV